MDIHHDFEIICEGINTHIPLVGNFLDEETSLLEYASNVEKNENHDIYVERQKDIYAFVDKKIEQIFGAEEVKKLRINREKRMQANIVDHHYFWNHPILLGGDILMNLHRIGTESIRDQIIFSASGVPMNNFFAKKGLEFDGNRVNIFSHKERHKIVYGFPRKEITCPSTAKNYDRKECNFLCDLFKWMNELSNENFATLSDQISYINYKMWPFIFEEDLREFIPHMYYISSEELAAELCTKLEGSFMHDAIFDEPFRAKVLQEFNGVTGAWHFNESIEDIYKGSTFFWGIENGERVRLTIQENFLVDVENKNIKIELTPDAIRKALDDGTIYPAMFVVYGILIFYGGVRPVAGFGSMNYLHTMWEAWCRSLQYTFPSEYDLLQDYESGFIFGPNILFHRDGQGKLVDSYALDILYRDGITREYLENLKKIQFNDALKPSLVDIYNGYIPHDKRKSLDITSKDLMGTTFDWIK